MSLTKPSFWHAIHVQCRQLFYLKSLPKPCKLAFFWGSMFLTHKNWSEGGYIYSNSLVDHVKLLRRTGKNRSNNNNDNNNCNKLCCPNQPCLNFCVCVFVFFFVYFCHKSISDFHQRDDCFNNK